jgi:hypothetical protein
MKRDAALPLFWPAGAMPVHHAEATKRVNDGR